MEDGYLLGDSDPELLRLRDQHLVWSAATQEGWRRAGLATGHRVLDAGCGPGFTTLELARLVGPRGSVVGLEPSEPFAAHLERRCHALGMENVDVRCQRLEDLDEDAEFDLIHLRWLLCFLPDPAAAVARLAARLKPGGRLVTLDYGQYRSFALAPAVPAMETVVRAVYDSWAAAGGSLDVQEETPQACENAGLRVTDISRVSGIARPGEPLFHWPETFLRGYLPRLVERGFLAPETCREFLGQWDRRKAQAGSFLMLPPLFRVIAERSGEGSQG